MTFRRSSNEEVGRPGWRRRHRSALLDCGVPPAVLESDQVLTYVLLHGDDPTSGWNSWLLSDEEAERLFVLLSQAIPNPIGYDLVADLQRRHNRR